MNRLLKLVVTIGVFFVARRIFASFSSGGSGGASTSGHAPPTQRGWVTENFVAVLQNSTGSHLSSHDVRLVSVGVFVYSIAVGVFSHILLGDRGFGRGFNGFIALIGRRGDSRPELAFP